jgi:Spy/CpxP family protein refolding chaperone
MSQNPSKQELLKALKKLEDNPNDSIAILGEIGITVLGGGAVAIAVAAIGVEISIPIVTALTGIVFVGAAPVSMIAAGAIAGGAAAWGLTQLVKHGSKMAAMKEKLKHDIQQRIREIEEKEKNKSVKPKDLSHFYGVLRNALEANLIEVKDAFSLLQAISSGGMSLSDGYTHINQILYS